MYFKNDFKIWFKILPKGFGGQLLCIKVIMLLEILGL